MNDYHEEEFRELLKRAMPRVADTELKQDLWPRMLRKMDETTIRASWLDWALLALLPVWFFFFPQVIPALLYHL
jgi:hypothetical protein